MRKIVLTFGLIAGAISAGLMLATLPFHNRIGNDAAMLLGYTTMVAASLFIYFGVRRYRDTVLVPGGSKDAADLVADFLGRPYDKRAYAAWLASAPDSAEEVR